MTTTGFGFFLLADFSRRTRHGSRVIHLHSFHNFFFRSKAPLVLLTIIVLVQQIQCILYFQLIQVRMAIAATVVMINNYLWRSFLWMKGIITSVVADPTVLSMAVCGHVWGGRVIRTAMSLIIASTMGAVVTSRMEDVLKSLRVSEPVAAPVGVGGATAWATVFDARLVETVKAVVSVVVNSSRRRRERG